MRLRVLLALAVALVAGGLALGMSGRAARSAGSDHVAPAGLVLAVPGGGVLCQRVAFLAADAARAQVLISTVGGSAPDLRLRFLDARGAVVASGRVQAGAHPGYVSIPLAHVEPAIQPASVCLNVGGSSRVLLGGEKGTVQLVSRVNGTPRAGAITLLYLRAGQESWWDLLPELDARVGLGKAAIFGDWTLPAAALLLVGVWVATLRLLLRELT